MTAVHITHNFKPITSAISGVATIYSGTQGYAPITLNHATVSIRDFSVSESLASELARLKALAPEAAPMNGEEFLDWLDRD